ncbi:hypothetical protein U9M48_040617, partial [Paspalum notatum var. saurae]
MMFFPRCNTSLLIDYCQDEGAHKYIIIDVGKTFRGHVPRWFVRHKVPRVDTILLTHEHADAILGLDDVRVVQPFSLTNNIDPTPISEVLAENTKRGVDRSVECTGNLEQRDHIQKKKKKRHVATFTRLLHTHYARKCRPLGGSFGAIEAHTTDPLLRPQVTYNDLQAICANSRLPTMTMLLAGFIATVERMDVCPPSVLTTRACHNSGWNNEYRAYPELLF